MSMTEPIDVRELIPARDLEQQARRDACASAGHPPGCYSPWDDRTYCRCGHHLYPAMCLLCGKARNTHTTQLQEGIPT